MVQFNLDVPPAEYVGTEREGLDLLNQLLELVDSDPRAFIGFDTETYGKKIPLKPRADGLPAKSDPLDWMQDTVTFWSLAAELDGVARRWTLPVQLLATFIPLLENPKANIVTWNGKYDAHVCYNSGVYVWASNYMDGLAMAHLVDENLQGNLGLKQTSAAEHPFFHPKRRHSPDTYWEELVAEELIEEWVPIPMTKFSDLFPKKDKLGRKIVEFEYSIFDLFKEWPDKVIDYASLDAHSTRLLCEHLRDVMKVLPIEIEEGPDSDMWEYFVEMEIPCTEVLWRMERRGLCIDVAHLQSLIDPINQEMLSIEKQVFQSCGWPVNLNSPAELGQLFFGEEDGQVKRGKEFIDAPGLGLAPVKMTKGGATSLPKPSTDKDVLDELAIQGVEEARLIKRHRSIAKTKSTYVDTVTKLCAHHLDSRLHPEFKQFGARTGRFSTKTPNSQNFPRPDTDEFGIRKAFIAPSGAHVLIVADYGQLEMRIMAHFSQDEGMIGAIERGMDLHCFAVEKMYGIPYDEVKGAKKRSDEVPYDDLTDREKDCLRKRQICKNTGFAIIYGAGAKRISEMLEIPIKEAEDIMELYYEAFPGVEQFGDDVVDQCGIYEYVTTLVGRRRRLPDVNSHQYIKRGHAEREARNAPIQGSAADITKAAMLNIEEDDECQRLGVRVVNQVHDELVMECPKKNAKRASKRVKVLMELPFGGQQALCVPTPADVKVVQRWDQAK